MNDVTKKVNEVVAPKPGEQAAPKAPGQPAPEQANPGQTAKT